MTRDGDWQQTYTGGVFYPLDPLPEEVHIEDIAHALSLLCRFAGHCEHFYSVAQHSVEVAELLPEGLRLEGLLHDAAEAYLVDLPRPVKRFVPQYRVLEREVELVIAERFRLCYPWPQPVKHADEVMLATEARDLMKPPPRPWHLGVEPREAPLEPWGPEYAEIELLRAFRAYERTTPEAA